MAAPTQKVASAINPANSARRMRIAERLTMTLVGIAPPSNS